MNKIRVTLAVISLACFLSGCSDRKENELPEEEIKSTGEMFLKEGDCYPDVLDRYVYPLKYKSDEWNELFAIPEAILRRDKRSTGNTKDYS